MRNEDVEMDVEYVEMSEGEELGCGNGCGNTWR